MSEENWRIPDNAGDYFTHKDKRLRVADRRPVIRSAKDLVGPGIGEYARRIRDFNSPGILLNGFFSADVTVLNSPASSPEPLVGQIVSDAELGGYQEFVGLDSGLKYRRVFVRNVNDPSSVRWGAWATV